MKAQIALSLALLSLALSCGSGDESGSAPGRRASGPNVLLVTLDTVRADRLGCYGWSAAQTPTLDQLAKDGVLFENAFTHVPFTMPSHTTILSGIHPSGHGLHINYTGVVAEDVPLLQEILQRDGYRTAAFVAARVLHDEFGLGRGFDVYENVPEGGTTDLEKVQRPGDQVCDQALAWLARPSEAPFFAWVHLFDAHEPRMTPPGFEGVGSDVYDSEIAFCDHQVGRLIEHLRASGELDDTLVIVTSDHGEGLGDHGEPSHGLFVYSSTMHVPWIMTWPSRIPAGIRPTELAGLVDLMPTVLGRLGRPMPGAVEGRDLGALLEGGEVPSQPLFFESEYAARTLHWAPLRGLISYPWKLIDAPGPELFDLAADPGELTNQAASEPERVERMREALVRLREHIGERQAGSILEDAGLDHELRQLGYLGGGGSGDPEAADGESLRDPKDALEIFLKVRRASELSGPETLAERMTLARDLTRATPESPSVWSLLAQTAFEDRAWAESEEAMRQCLDLLPDVPWRLSMLGDAVREQGRVDEALELYRKTIALEPDHAQTYSRIGTIHARRGELAAALEAFARHCALEPESANALTNLANAQLAAGQIEAGVGSLERALQSDATCIPALRTLTEAHLAVGRTAKAVETLEHWLEVAPEEPAALANLAWILATTADEPLRRAARARELAERGRALQPNNARMLDVLAAAEAANGNFERAIALTQSAIDLARTQYSPAQQSELSERLASYRAGRALRL